MHPRIFARFFLVTIAAAAAAVPLAVAGAQRPASLTRFDQSNLGGLRYRMVGPTRGGRVTTVTGVPQEPRTFYMGSTGGGVWKTTDAGAHWFNVSDGYFAAGSMGSIDVSDSDPSIIYAGTGSDGLRSNVSIGVGIYKSTDAGESWTHIGLDDVGQIGAVVIDPTNPEVVYVAAIGNPFKPTPQRGVYRTRDGGRTWDKVLFVSDSTGAVDLELQPGNPSVVYATMWRAERKPWTIISGAREGGFYRSTDGGTTWKKITAGLPHELVGKGDLAVSPAMPQRVWLLLEAKPGGGLYRSDDAGQSFTAVDTTTAGLITRPFYYLNVDVDPTNADALYVGTESFYTSKDGGRSWRTLRTPHGDNHDLWINPDNPEIMIESNDGGANVTLDGGRTWSSIDNQPTAEMYQVYVDNQFPYRLYGAQQDNSTVIVPSLPTPGFSNDLPWKSGPGCETGPIMAHLTNPDTVYASCKGQYSRMSLRTGQEKHYWVGAQSLYGNHPADLIYRFQRVSPMELSPSRPGVIYYGSQYVHRTKDEGVTWERISPDLTWNPPEHRNMSSGEPITIDATGEENYSTLYAIRESPLETGVIWTGSNDGPFYVTRDDGEHWSNVTPSGQPQGCRVQNIEPSPHRKGSAYYAVLCYLLGDFHPYLWRTDDYGESWTLLTTGDNGIPADQPTRVVREDPEREGLLYAGTEFGLYISYDNGAHWSPFQLNLPATPVTDLKVHRGDLVVATQGRSFWILDDLTPVRKLSDAIVASASHLFAPREAVRMRYRSGFGGRNESESPTEAQYPPPGATIDYWLGANVSGPVQLDFMDADGKIIRSFSSAAPRGRSDNSARQASTGSPAAAGTSPIPANPGLNRFIWDMSYPGPWDSNARRSGRNGPLAAPGSYEVRLTIGEKSETRALEIKPDPRVTQDGVTIADMRDQLAHNLEVRDLVSDVNKLVDRLTTDEKRLSASSSPSAADSLAQIRARLAKLVTPPVRYSPPGLQEHIRYLYRLTTSADQKVGQDARERYEFLREQLDQIESR